MIATLYTFLRILLVGLACAQASGSRHGSVRQRRSETTLHRLNLRLRNLELLFFEEQDKNGQLQIEMSKLKEGDLYEIKKTLGEIVSNSGKCDCPTQEVNRAPSPSGVNVLVKNIAQGLREEKTSRIEMEDVLKIVKTRQEDHQAELEIAAKRQEDHQTDLEIVAKRQEDHQTELETLKEVVLSLRLNLSDIATLLQHVTTTTSATPLTTSLPLARDCWDLRSIYNITTDGVYNVMSPSSRTVAVRCDMTTDGGGWIVFQKRYKGTVDFNQTFARYRDGFGTLSDEFWMGNDLLHQLTQDNRQKLRVDLCSFSGEHRHATHDNFTVGPESDQYRLHVGEYRGDAGDALNNQNSDLRSNNQRFSTPNADNDIYSGNCALDYHCGWWFASCFKANLNGVYQDHTTRFQGIKWIIWRSDPLKGSEMKFRPAHVPSISSTAFSCPIH